MFEKFLMDNIGILFSITVVLSIYFFLKLIFWDSIFKWMKRTNNISEQNLKLDVENLYNEDLLGKNLSLGKELSTVWYSKKTDGIYYNWEKIEWADVWSFEELWNLYAKDKNHVYSEWKILDLDVNKLKILWDTWYIKDDKNVYFMWKKIEWIDARTLELFREYYVKDENAIYFDWIEIEWVDMDTFKILEDPKYIKDKNNVYFLWDKIEWADPKTFKIFWKDTIYSKDKNSVYYEYKKIEWADPETFQELWSLYAKDKNHV